MLGVFITLSQILCLGTGGYIQAFGPAHIEREPTDIPVHLQPQFLHIILPSVSTTLPISPPILALFIAYMYDRRYAPSTVTTYVSALGYCHKLSGFLIPPRPFYRSDASGLRKAWITSR